MPKNAEKLIGVRKVASVGKGSIFLERIKILGGIIALDNVCKTFSRKFIFSHFSVWLSIAFVFQIILSGCGGGRGQGNDTLAEGGLGISIELVDGNNQIHARRQVYTQPLIVRVTSDEGGNGVPEMTVRFVETTNTGAIFKSSSVTNSRGETSINVTSPNLYSATVKIEATVAGASGSAQFTLTTIPDTVTSIDFGPIAPPAVHMADDIVPIQSFQVYLKDSYGFLIDTNNQDDIVLNLQSGSATLSGTLTKRVSRGVATFNNLTYQEIENISLRATHVPYGLTADKNMQVVNGRATQLVFTTPPAASYVAGDAIEPVLELRDKFGNRVTYGADASASISLGLQQGVGTLAGTTSINATAGVASFVGKNIFIDLVGANKMIRATKAATSGFGATAALTKDSSVFAITPAPAQNLAVAGLAAVIAGDCNSYVVTSRDIYTNLSGVTSNKTMSISLVGSGQFYSDASCTTSVASTTLPLGSDTATVYYKNTIAPSSNSVTFDDGPGGLTAVSQSVVVAPAPPTEFYITGPTTLVSGLCSSAYTVLTRDAFGNTSSVTSAKTATLSGGNGKFYSDSACTSQVTSLNYAIGSSSKTVYFSDNIAETVTLVADDGAGGLTPSNHSVTIGPDHMVWSGPTSILSGSCSAYSVVAKDKANNTANVLSNTTINLTEAGNGAFYSDAACTTSVTSALITAGTSTATVYYQNATAQAASIAATDAAALFPMVSLTINVLPDHIVMTGPTTLVTNICSAIYNFTAKDAAGNTVNVASNTTIYLTGKGSGGFYSDSSCTTPVASDQIVLAAGMSSGSFYFKDATNEGVSLTADDGVGGMAAGVVNVSIGPDRLLLSGPSSSMSGVCSSFTVTSSDPSELPANMAFNTVITLTGKGNGAFYSDNTCSTALTGDQVTIAAGASSANFYFNDDVAESLTLNADDTGSLTAAVKSFATGPDQLAMSGASNLKSGTCSSAFTITTKDTAGNTAAVLQATTLTLTGSGNGVFYSDSGCTTALAANQLTIANNTSSASFYFKGSVAESLTFGADDGPGALAATSLPVSVGPSHFILTGPSSLKSGTCSAVYTLTSKDAANNTAGVLTATTVNLNDASLTGTFYSDNTCATAVTTLSLAAAASSGTFYFKETTAALRTISVVDAAGILDTGSTSTAVGPDHLVIIGNLTTSSGTCEAYSLRSRDTDNNDANVLTNTTLNLDDGAGSGTFYSDAACTTTISSKLLALGSNSVTVYYKNPASEAVTMTVTDAASILASATLNVSTGPDRIDIAGPTSSKSGVCAAYTVTARDTFGNAAQVNANLTVNLSDGTAAGAFYSNNTCSTGITSTSILIGASSKTVYYKNNVAETATLNADDASASLMSDAHVVNIGPDHMTLTGTSPIKSGSCQAYTVTFKDTSNATKGVLAATTIDLSDGAGLGTFYSDSGCTSSVTQATANAGTNNVVFYYKDTTAEAVTLAASDNAASLTSASLNVTVGPDRLAIAGAASFKSGTCQAYNVNVQDAAANTTNLITNITVNLTDGTAAGGFYSNATCTTSVTQLAMSAGSSTAAFYYKSPVAEDLTLSAADNASSLSTGTLSVSSGPDRLLISGTSSARSGVCVALQVTSKDFGSNTAAVSSNVTVNLTDASAGGTFYTDSGCATAATSVTITSGTSSTVFYYQNPVAEVSVLTAADAASNLASSSMSLTTGPDHIVITGAATFKSGTCQAYAATTKDSSNTTANVLTTTVINLSQGAALGAFYSNASCTTATASISIAAGANSTTFYYKNNTAQSITLSAADNGAALTTGTLGVTSGPDRLVLVGNSSFNSGTCQAYLVRTKDAAGNFSGVFANTTVNLSDGAAAGSFYSDNTCATSASQVSIAASSSSETIYYKNDSAQSIVLSAVDAASNLTTGSLNVTSAPDRLTISGNSTFKSGSCQAFTLTARDASGSSAPVLTTATINLTDGTALGEFYSNNACTTSTTSLNLSAGSSSGSFYYKDNTGESITLTATDASAVLTAGTLNVDSGPNRITVSGATSANSGTCQAYTLTTKDAASNTKGVFVATTIDLTDGTASGGFYSNNTCTTAITQTSLAAAADTITVYYKNSVAENINLSFADNSANLTAATLSLVTGPDRLHLAGSTSFKAGSCQLYTVTSKDASGNTAAVLQATTIDLTDGAANGTFYSEASCTSVVTQRTIASAASSVNVYYKSAIAESATLNASDNASLLSAATLNITGGPDHLVITGNTSFKSGTCQAYTITAQDPSNNSANVMALTAINLTDGSANGGFYSNATCATAITQTSMASGTNAVTVYYLDTTAESITLSAADNASSLTTGTLAITSGPDRLALTGTASFKSGICQAFTVASKDAAGNTKNVLTATTINLSDAAGAGDFYLENTCVTSITDTSIASGSSSSIVYYKNTSAESVTLTAADAAANLTTSTLALSIGPDRISLSGNTSFKSGTCQAYTLVSEDSTGTDAAVLSNTTINLDDGAASGGFYSGNTCTTSISSTVILSGSDSKIIYYKNNVAENILLSADDAAASLASASLALVSGPSQLTLSGSTSFNAGSCQAYTITTKDASNLTKNVLADTTIDLTDGAAAGDFYSDNTCATLIAQTLLTNGTSSKTIYYKDDVAESVTLLVADNPVNLTAASLAIVAGPDRLVVSGSTSFKSGTCQPFTITAKDAAGNTENVISTTTINLNDGAASGVFHSNNTCSAAISQSSIATGNSSATVYYIDAVGEAMTLTMSDASSNLSSGTLNVASGPDKILLSASSTFNSGTCQAVTVTTKDASANTTAVLSNTTVLLTDGAASGAFFSDNLCTTGITQTVIADGDSSDTVYYLNNVSESISLGASDSASSLTSATLAVTAGPDRFIVTGNTAFKSGTCQAYSITSKDAAGNTKAVLALTTINLSDGAAAGAFYSDSGCATGISQTSMAAAASSVTVYFKDTTAESITLSATDNASSLTTGTLSIASGPDRLIFSGNSTFQTGTCQAYTLTSKDAAAAVANVLSNTTINLSDGTAAGSFYSDNSCATGITQTSIASGANAVTVYYKNNSAEAVTLTAADTPANLTAASLSITGGPDRLAITGSSAFNSGFKSGTCQTLTVTTKDASNTTANALSNITVDLADGAATGDFYSDNTCTTGITQTSIASNSNSSIVYYKTLIAETITLTSADNAASLTTGTLATVSGPAQLVITGNASFNSGTCQTYTLTTKDASGNTAGVLASTTVDFSDSGAAGSFYTNNTCTTAGVQLILAANASSGIIYYKNNSAESATLTAVDNPANLTAASLNVESGPDRLQITGSMSFVSGSCVAYAITTADANNIAADVLTNLTVNVNDGTAVGDFYSDNSCATLITQASIASGARTVTVYYKNNVAENITLSAADDAASLTSASLNVTQGPSKIVILGSSTFKSGVCQSYTLRARDAADNDASVLANTTLNVSDGAASGSFYSENTCSTPTTSASIPSGSAGSTVYYKNNTAESAVLTADDAAAVLTSGTLSVESGPDRLSLAGSTTIKSGVCAAYAVTSKDTVGNTANVLTATTINLTDGTATGGFYSDAVCSAAITQTSIASGANNSTVYYKTSVAENITLSAADNAANLASSTLILQSGPDHLIVAGSSDFKSGTCQTYTVTSKDTAGNTTNVLTATTINLTDGAASGDFYSNNTCVTSTASVAMASGASTATFYYKIDLAENIVLNAADNASNLTAGTLAVNSGPDRIIISGGASFKSGTCQAYDVVTKDATNATADVLSAVTIDLTDGVSSGGFFSDNTCATAIIQTSLSLGENTKTVYYSNTTSESITLSAADNASSLTTGTLNVTSSPDHLILTGSTSFKSGTCQSYSVVSKDAANNTKNVLTNTLVDMTDGAASGGFFSDNTCATAATQLTITAGSSSATIYYKDDVGEAITLTATDAASYMAPGTLNVTAGPDRFIVSGATTVTSGTCQAYVVTTKDASGNTKNALALTTIDLSDGAASGSYYSDSGCTAGITQSQIALGANTVTVYYRNNVAENAVLSAADNASNLTTGSLSIASGPDHLTIAANSSFKSGSCQAVTVTTKDTAANSKNPLSAVVVDLSDGVSSGGFFSDNTCASPITQTTIATTAHTNTVYYKNTTAESITLSAADNAGVLGTGTTSVASGPDRLKLAGSATPKTGACVAYTVSSEDMAGNTAGVLTVTTVNLTDGTALGSFYSDNTCATATTTASLSLGSSSTTTYYKTSTAESITLSAADNASDLTTATLNISSGPDHLVIAGNSSFMAGTCQAYTVTTKDTANNTANTLTATTINLADGTALGSFYSDNTCATGITSLVVSQGSSSGDFYYKDNVAEAITLSATDAAASLTAGSFSATSGPDRLILSGPTNISSGSCSTVYTVTSKDTNGNVAAVLATTTVDLDDGTAAGVFYSDNTCTTGVTSVSITNATSSASFYYKDDTSESITLEVSDNGAQLAGSTLAVEVGPDHLTITGPATLKSGICSAAYTVTTKDAGNNTAAVLSPASVSLTGKGSGEFYSDSTCLTASSTLAYAAGASTATFYFKDSTAESLSFSADDGPGGLTAGTLAVETGPDRLVISASSTFNSGVCQTVTIVTKDAAGATASTLSATTIDLDDGAAAGAFYTENTCTTSTSQTSIAAGANTSTVYYKNTTAEAITLTAADAASVLASGNVSVSTGPDRLIVTGSSPIVSGACQAYTVTTKDAASATENALADITVNLTDGAASGTYYSDNACTGAVTQTTITSGTSASTIYYRNNVAESITLSAADAAASLTTGTLTITTGPDHLIVAVNSSFKSGTCQSVTITAKDLANNTANVLSNTTLNLNDGSALGGFFSDNTCATAATTASIANGSNNVIVYYKNTTAEAITLNVDDAAASLVSGTASTTSGPDRLLLAGSTSIKSGACITYTVTTKDAAGNTANTLAATTIDITDGAASGAFYSDNTCATSASQVSIASGANLATFYYKNNIAESLTLNAADTPANLTAATLSVASGPDHLVIAGATTPRSGTCQAYTITSNDVGNTAANVLSTTTVNLTDGAASGAFYSDNGCATGITSVDITSGTNNVTVYYKDSSAEAAVLSAADDAGALTTGTLSITLGPDHIVVAGSTSFKSGTCQAYTLTTKDATNTTADVLTATTINLADGVASGVFYSDVSCSTVTTQSSIAAGSNTSTVYYKNNTGEAITVTATDAASSLTTGTLSVNSGPNQLTLAGSSSFKSGSCQSFSVVTKDAAGNATNALASVTVNLDDSTAVGVFYSDNGCSTSTSQTSIASGANTATVYYLNNTAEAITLSASDNAANLSTGTLNVTAGPSQLAITGTSQFKSGVCTDFTVTTEDAAGATANAVAAVTINLTDGTASGSYFSDNVCTTGVTQTSIANGSSSSTVYYKNDTAESITLNATDNASSLTTGTLSVTTGPDRLILTGNTTFESGTCQTYTVTTKDTAGNTKNALAAVTIDLSDGIASGAFYTGNTCSTVATQATLSAGSSSTSVYYKNNVAEAITLSAADNASSLATGTLAIVAGPDHLDLSGPGTPLSGECITYTVTTRDAGNNAADVAANVTVDLADGSGAGTIYSDNTCSTVAASIVITSGTQTKNFYYKNNTSEAVSLTAADAATNLTSDTHAIYVEPNHIIIAGTTSFKSGTCQAYTLTTKDATNATAAISTTLTLNLDDGAGSGGFYSNNTCTTTITSQDIAATTNTATVYYKNNTAESVTISATDAAGNLTAGTMNLTVGPDRLVIGTATAIQSGTCQAYTVTSKDTAGNTAAVTALTTVNLTDGLAAGDFYLEATCATGITSKNIASGASTATVYYKNNTAEAITLSAADNAGVLTTGTLAVTTGPNHLILSGNTSFKSGTCQTYTVTSKDAANATTNVSGNLTVNLSDGLASGVFYSDNTCTTSTTSVTILDGSNSAFAYYRNDSAEAATLNADDAATNLTSGTLSITIGPDHLVLTGATTVNSGVCQAYTITSKDTANATANVLADVILDLTDAGAAGQYYSENTCVTAITTKTIPDGSNSVTVYYKDNTAESLTLTATDQASSLTAATLAIATGPSKIILTGSSPILAGACEAYTVTTKDAADATTGVLAATTINLSDGVASGVYYSENTCATPITSIALAIGESTDTVYYKNNSAESMTLNATDAAASLTTGTLALVTGPNHLTWTGAAAPLADACEAYTVSAQDATNTNANVLTTTSIALTGAGSGSFYSDSGCSLPITSSSITINTASTTVYYKNALGETITFSADDGVGAMTAGTKLVSVDCGATSFEVTLAGGGTAVSAGSGFDVKLTAKASGTTKTCYVGSHTINWTMNGLTAGTLDCGQVSGVPVAPSQTSLTFTAGEAVTTSSDALFKQIQADATITASDGTISGTSGNLSVGAGAVCRVQLRTAAANGGTVFSAATIDLNLSSLTPSSSSTVYAAGYDAFGQYNSDVTAVWSGTGAVYPWPRTTTNTDDTASVYGVKVGTGTLQADYNGGGGSKTASASFTITSTNAIGILTSTTTDSDANTHLGSNTVYQTRDWNAGADAVTAWKTDSTKAWYNEAFGTTRGSRKAFPDRVFLVANSNGLDIIDATNNHLYMRFNKGAGSAIDSVFGSPVSAMGLNGKIYVSMRDSSSTTGAFVILDFVANTVTHYGSGGRYLWNGGGIENRNTASSWSNTLADLTLAGFVGYRLSVRRIGTIDYVLLGANIGAALYQDNSGTISIYKDPTTAAVKATYIASDGKLYYAETTNGVHRYDASLPLSANWAPTRTYTNSATVNLGLKNLNDLSVAEGTSTQTINANTIVTGTNEGLSVIQEHSSLGSESSKDYTIAGTGYVPFSNIVNFNGTSGAVTMSDANAVNRTTTMEMLFKPNSTWTSASPVGYLFDRGQLGANAYGIRFNSAGDGSIDCYTYRNSTVTSVYSTTLSWTAGQWYHVACVYANSTNDMQVTIYVDGVAQNSTVINTMNTWAGSTGPIYFGSRGGSANFLDGSIDEFRLSNITRYIADFFVPNTPFAVDGNTFILHHFDDVAGATATASAGANGTLNSGAWFSTPLYDGTSDVVTGVDVNVQGGTATGELVCSGTNGSWNELTGLHTTTPAVSSSATGINAQSVDLYQVDAATDSDILIGLTSGGIRLHRR